MFEETIYQVGEFCLFRETNKTEVLGQITKILPRVALKNRESLPMLKVQWFYSKHDLLALIRQDLQDEEALLIADNEVFSTSHSDRVFADAIVRKAKVFSFDQYLQQDAETRQSAFFSRAGLVYQKLHPPISEWSHSCKCKRPLNPDLQFVLCADCQAAHHLKCTGYTAKTLQLKGNKFQCQQCRLLASD